jgi:PIN domain nuclease of toxin-antitoxin system
LSLVVLDASALLALLQSERGAKIVADEIQGAAISAVNLGEAAQRQYRDGKTSTEFEAMATAFALNIISVDGPLALDAAEIREIARQKGLSQADCICLALAKRLGVNAMTADQKWLEIAGEVGVKVQVVR